MAKRLAEAAADELGMQTAKVQRTQGPFQASSPPHWSSESDEGSNQCFFDAAGDTSPLATASSAGREAVGVTNVTSWSLSAAGVPPTQAPPPQHAWHAEKGPRVYMEDAHAVAALPDCGAWVGAVFDGHGGSFVSQFCADNLLPRLRTALAAASVPLCPSSESCSSSRLPDPEAVKDALGAAFAAADRELAESHAKEARACGTTAAVALVTDDLVFTAHCGDSRVLLVRPSGVQALTVDHSPTRKDERERIRKAGGRIVWQNGLRVMGALSMTRAIGDHFLRSHGVIADPEISVVTRTPDDELLLLATDGLFNYVSNEEAAAAAQRALSRAKAAGLPRRAAMAAVPRALARLALARGGGDNVTVMLVDLQQPAGSSAPPTATAAAAAAATVPVARTPSAGPAPSPFQAPDLQLPHLTLPRIRTRLDVGRPQLQQQQMLLGLLNQEMMSRAASEPAAAVCETWSGCGAMPRAASAPTRFHHQHHTVTTGGPAMPTAAPAAAAAAPAAALTSPELPLTAAAARQHAWAEGRCSASAFGLGPIGSLMRPCPVAVAAGGGDGCGVADDMVM